MNRFLSTPIRREFIFLVVLPFLLWMAVFWGFITARLLPDVGDGSYYQQTLFFVNNLIRGVYPQWDPTYCYGFPYSFFLRRIGDGNPFYLLVAGAKLIGATDFVAYRFFLTVYYFLGVVGFWLIARLFLKERLAYTAAFLILLFSGWGGRVFSDYIILLFIPLVWFFYFFLAFALERKKHQFLGVLLFTAIGLTTYIPFFFITTVLAFCCLSLLFFWREAVEFFTNTAAFIRGNKLFVLAGVIFFMLALAPEAVFFRDSRHGEFVMPGRNVGTAEMSTLAVSMNHIKVGDLMAQGYFDRVFADHNEMTAVDFFVTYFFFLMVLVSFINPLSRRTAFLLLNVLFLVVISITDTTPAYKVLYDHVFIFKYMRMMSFFFWIAAFPMAVLFAAWQLEIFLVKFRGRREPLIFVYILVVHLLFGAWALTQNGVNLTSWIAIAASFLFFAGVLRGQWSNKVLGCFLLAAVMIQSVALINYLPRNTLKAGKNDQVSRYQALASTSFDLKRSSFDSDITGAGIYCGTRWYQELFVHMPPAVRLMFTSSKFYLVDNTVTYDDEAEDGFIKLAQVWQNNMNVALLPARASKPQDVRSLRPMNVPAQAIDNKTPFFKILSFDANTVKLTIDLPGPKFLVWSDNYHSGWHVFINGKEARLLRADYSFKGVWLPEGKSEVLFRFLTPAHYFYIYFLGALFLFTLTAVLFLSRREGFNAGKGDDDAF